MKILRSIMFIFAFTIFSSLAAFSHTEFDMDVRKANPPTENIGNITVDIPDIKEKKGTIRIFLFDSEKGFSNNPKIAFREVKLTSFGQSASYTFKDIPFGEYVVAVFQDLDEDDKLDKNFIGIPVEPIAMSNMNKMAIPSYKKSTILLKQEVLKLTLTFING